MTHYGNCPIFRKNELLLTNIDVHVRITVMLLLVKLELLYILLGNMIYNNTSSFIW